uniref:Uncharacterized protein n=1 Tax=Meloidogyne javanica TaxID=6303 RepID=A0A915MER9_MELJA
MMYTKPRKPGHIQSLIKRCKHFISRSFLNIRRGTATTSSLFVRAAVNHNKERRRRAKQKYRPRYVPSIYSVSSLTPVNSSVVFGRTRNTRGVQISSSYVSATDSIFSPRGGYSLVDLNDLDIPVVEATPKQQKQSKSNHFNGKFCTSPAVYGVEVPNTNSSSRSSTLSSYSGYFDKNGVHEETMSYTSNVRGSYDDLDIDAVMDDKTFTLQRSYYLSSSPPFYLDGSCTASVQSHYVGDGGDSSTSQQSHYLDELDVLEEPSYHDSVIPPNRYASLLAMSSTFDFSNAGEEGYSFASNPSHYVDERESMEEFCPDSVTPQNSYISLLVVESSAVDFSDVIEKFRQQQTQHPPSNKLRLDARYGVEVPPTVSSCSVGTNAWTVDGSTTTRGTQSVTGIEDELNLEDSGIDDNIKEKPLNDSFYCYPPCNSAYSLMALDELNLEDSTEETKQITVKASNLYPKKHRSVFDGVVVPKTDESLSCIEESSGVHYDFKVDKVGITVDEYKGDPKITKKFQLSSLRRTKSCGDMPKSFVVPETGGISLYSPSNCDSSYYIEDSSSKEFFSCSSDSWLDKEYFVDSALAKAIFDARPQAMDVDPSFSGEMENNDQLQYYNQFKAQQQFRNCAMDASNMNSFLQLLQCSFPSDCTDRLLDKLFFDYRQLVCQKQYETNFGNDKWDGEYFWL